jgi:hypothetical protein
MSQVYFSGMGWNWHGGQLNQENGDESLFVGVSHAWTNLNM